MSRTIFNSCDSRFSQGKLPHLELLMWACSLVLYKKAGYKTKLYCTKEDIYYLKKEKLFNLYDEIDTDTFENNLNPEVNTKRFWSYRKMEALRHESKLDPTAIYSDTDVLIFKPLTTKQQALFWCLEDDEHVYQPWENISCPADYSMPEFLAKADSTACNCGIVWLENTDIIEEWYQEYMKFVLNNPCELARPDHQNNIFACNSEQRIIKAILDREGVAVDYIATAAEFGLNSRAFHLYGYKIFWKYQNYIQHFIDTNAVGMALDEFKLFCDTVLAKSGYQELYRRSQKWQLQI